MENDLQPNDKKNRLKIILLELLASFFEEIY